MRNFIFFVVILMLFFLGCSKETVDPEVRNEYRKEYIRQEFANIDNIFINFEHRLRIFDTVIVVDSSDLYFVDINDYIQTTLLDVEVGLSTFQKEDIVDSIFSLKIKTANEVVAYSRKHKSFYDVIREKDGIIFSPKSNLVQLRKYIQKYLEYPKTLSSYDSLRYYERHKYDNPRYDESYEYDDPGYDESYEYDIW